MGDRYIRRVIIDVDCGLDDYVALLLSLHAEKIGELKIEAIVCTHGNTSIDNVVKNVLRLLEIVGRIDIPVYKGASMPIILPEEAHKRFYGEDGFGDLDHDTEPDISNVRDLPGAVAIYEIIRNNPHNVSVICLAPLTTLALTLKLFDDAAEKIKDVWIMGGNYPAFNNEPPSAEYNFFSDPEAAHVVIECLKCNIFILPWESCLTQCITLDWRFNVLGDDTPALSLLTMAEKKIDVYESDTWQVCDAFLIFCYLNPKEHIIEKSSHNTTVELHGEKRGQVVYIKTDNSNVVVIEKFEHTLLKDMLLETKYSI